MGEQTERSQEQQVNPADWELVSDEAIAAHGGAREAVKALLIANAALERELALAAPALSHGFSRGWHRQRWYASDTETSR